MTMTTDSDDGSSSDDEKDTIGGNESLPPPPPIPPLPVPSSPTVASFALSFTPPLGALLLSPPPPPPPPPPPAPPLLVPPSLIFDCCNDDHCLCKYPCAALRDLKNITFRRHARMNPDSIKGQKKEYGLKTVYANGREFLPLYFEKLLSFSWHQRILLNQRRSLHQCVDFRGLIPHVIIQMDFSNAHLLREADATMSEMMNNPKAYILVMIVTVCVPGQTPKSESWFFVSDDKREDQFFVDASLRHLIHALKVTYALPDGVPVHIWSDGAKRHFKSAGSYWLLSKLSKTMNVNIWRHFFQSNHGKGPYDAEGGTLKISAYRAIMSAAKIVLMNVAAFVQWAAGNDALVNPPAGAGAAEQAAELVVNNLEGDGDDSSGLHCADIRRFVIYKRHFVQLPAIDRAETSILKVLTMAKDSDNKVGSDKVYSLFFSSTALDGECQWRTMSCCCNDCMQNGSCTLLCTKQTLNTDWRIKKFRLEDQAASKLRRAVKGVKEVLFDKFFMIFPLTIPAKNTELAKQVVADIGDVCDEFKNMKHPYDALKRAWKKRFNEALLNNMNNEQDDDEEEEEQHRALPEDLLCDAQSDD